MFNEDIVVTTTIGELVDLIGIASAEICPDGLGEMGEQFYMSLFAQVSQLLASHFSGERPFPKDVVELAAIVRHMKKEERNEQDHRNHG